MAQAQLERKFEEQRQNQEMKESKPNNLRNLINVTRSSSSSNGHNNDNNNNSGVSFKFNAQAPEFVPRSYSPNHGHGQSQNQNQNHNQAAQMPFSGYFYPFFHYLGATGGSDWFFVGGDHQDSHNAAGGAAYLISNPNNIAMPNSPNKATLLNDDLRQKILKQVEYQFSDMSLLANESMSKHISKDPEGYVPISVIASTKKMKSLINNNNHFLVQALQCSSKLVISEDNKKTKRKIPFTEKDREELMSRTVVVENLPEDHSHQNLEKIFSVVGSVKTIRICHPQESNSSRSKNDFFMSNKLHALLEFESPETADKAADKLNDERNWRKGLRVRVLVRCSPKSVLKCRKSEFDGLLDDEEFSLPESNEYSTESNADDNSGSTKKGWARVRGKSVRGRGQSHGGRGLLAPTPQTVSSPQCDASAKSGYKGPRMPDGTRGFTMGRGKPTGASTLTSLMAE